MILLTLSRGKGEETVRLQLPASPAEIGETFAFLDRISLDTTATAILDVSSNVPVLYRCLYDVDVEDSEQFQKLQKLAERTEALSPAKAAIFSGALDAECVWNLEGALTVADRLDEYMALAEIVVKYLDGDPGSLDYDEEWAAEDNKFRSVTSFTASRASLRELRDYLADTLKYARIRAERQIKAGELPGGWFDPKDWDGWQKHMEGLIHRLDGVLALEGSTLELAHPPAPTVPELTM